ncbi:hypothetical protein BDV95DRAFT_503590 [Massariosphaeria phaeospora]|uniref:Uncharacterized protein n=1 Tax=Massariosphaeria phaeospora TaxID=100035 RepID=A0A7C8M3A4_9PLEO|nr:hypothetical protein BDV95DRAFT_503590 [Massariosphaeria phaeospora]
MADIGDEEHSGADDFAHHSLIFHDTLVSSQVAYDSEMEKTWSSFSSLLTSFDTATTENSTPTHGENQIATLPGPSTMAVTPLGSLPDAKHIRAIYPQTPTPNLVCVLTSPAQRREVFVKKGGYRMDLCEITVADNTKSGFKVSFWFRPSKGTGQDRTRAQGDLLSTLSSIRVGDVLLLRNIALNVFRDDVYGQSLNPSITRARTSIEVLKSGHKVSTSALGAMPAAVVATFMSVRRWANSHVAPEQTVSKKRKGEEQRSNSAKRSLTPSFGADEDLPPDTMEPS